MKKGNVILDIDGTLISAVKYTELEKKGYQSPEKEYPKNRVKTGVSQGLKWVDMEGYYRVFYRPDLEDFLDWLFKHFNVAIWTAASKDYATFILRHIINPHGKRKQGRHVDFMFFDYHTQLSEKLYQHHKDLRLIWEVFGPTVECGPFKNYQPTNTVIIDDFDEVYKPQPCHAIPIKAFDFFEVQGGQQDTQLKKIRQRLAKAQWPSDCPAKA